MSPLIQLHHITKTYGHGSAAYTALRGVDFSIASGEFVALMGPSGSGKSSVMNILGCLDVPSSGEYYFEQQRVDLMNRDQRAHLRRASIGFVFQGFNLLARTSAQENVELPLLYRGVPSRERHTLAMAALETVGLTQWHTHTPAELSGGQQQRVAIARALVTQPRVILADEPTGNLDSARKLDIIQLLQQLNREKSITIVMVTHEPDMAQYAQRIIDFTDGVVSADRRINLK